VISLARYTSLLELREFRQIILVSLLGDFLLAFAGWASSFSSGSRQDPSPPAERRAAVMSRAWLQSPRCWDV